MAYQPKNYRKFVATAATATLVAQAVAPLASAATVSDFTDVAPQYQEAVSFLLEKGASNGKTETQFGVYDNITRQDAAVQLVKVLGLEVDTTITKTQFTDVPARTAPYVQALVDAGITNGKTETQFGANEEITRGQLAVWIQKGFELEGSGSVDFTDVASQYQEAVSALKENGITQGINETQFGTYENATRGDYAIFLYRAAQVEKVETPEVTEIVVANAKELTITFNQPIKESSIIKNGKVIKGLITIDTFDAFDASSSATLSADGKTLTLRAVNGNTWKEGTHSFTLVDGKVVDVNGETVKGYETTFTVKADETRPEVTGVNYIDKYQYEITFSEPVKALGEVTYSYADGTNKDIKVVSRKLSADGKSYIVKFEVNTLSEKEILVDFSALEDFAHNVSKPQTASITISNADQVAPEVVSVTATGVDSTKYGKVTTFDIQLSEAILVEGNYRMELNGKPVSVKLSDDQTVLHATVHGEIDGTALLYIAEKTFKDLNGNANAEMGKWFDFEIDKTLPVVQSSKVVYVNNEATLVVTYNKDIRELNVNEDRFFGQTFKYLTFTSVDEYGMETEEKIRNPKVELYNVGEDGKTNQVSISLAGLQDHTDYKVELPKGFAVTYFNKGSEAGTVSFNSGDVKVAANQVKRIHQESPGTVSVWFTEPVNKEDAEDISKYIVEDATVVSAEVVKNNSKGAEVVLTLENDTVEKSGHYYVTVDSIQAHNSGDTANVTTTKTVYLDENVVPKLVSSVVPSVTSDTLEVKLTFDDAVTSGKNVDFELYVNGKATGEKINALADTITKREELLVVKWAEAHPYDRVADLLTADSIKLVATETIDITDNNGNLTNVKEIVVK